MKTATIIEIKRQLEKQNYQQLLDYCLRLTKFKKENKELLSFLLFESDDLSDFVENVKKETAQHFMEINKTNIYFIRKSVRKILRNMNKYIRISSSKQVEAELLIYFCNCLFSYSIPIKKSRQLTNLYDSQLKKITAILSSLHPDLQYDLRRQMLKQA